MTREPDDIAYEREADIAAEADHAYRRQVERINAYVGKSHRCTVNTCGDVAVEAHLCIRHQPRERR